MTDLDVQKVKIKGPLFAIRNILSILKDLLAIVLLLVILWQVFMLIPKISAGLDTMGNLQNLMNSQNPGGNSNLQNNNQMNNQGLGSNQGNQNSDQGKYLESVAKQMDMDVQQGKWDDATAQLNILQGFSSQMTAEQQQYLTEIGQAIQNKDKNSFSTSFNKLSQSENSNQVK